MLGTSVAPRALGIGSGAKGHPAGVLAVEGLSQVVALLSIPAAMQLRAVSLKSALFPSPSATEVLHHRPFDAEMHESRNGGVQSAGDSLAMR
jgi:hypothetical protein